MKLIIEITKSYLNYTREFIFIPNNKITVLELKQILSEKYCIDISCLRLLTKISGSNLVTLTDCFPLSFFFIKEGSTIQVEFLQLVKNKTRENFFNKLGIVHKPSMDVIKESTLEDIADCDTSCPSPSPQRKNSLSPAHLIIKLEDRLYKAIKKNKIEEFVEIMNNGEVSIDINKPMDNMDNDKKYSPIHYAAKYGYYEILSKLIEDYDADVNLISPDGWSALHIGSYKGYEKIVTILINNRKTNYDLCLPKIGTALHVACKNNNFKIVSLLLHVCKIDILNDEGLLPIQLAKDHNIKKLLKKINEKPGRTSEGSDKSINEKISIQSLYPNSNFLKNDLENNLKNSPKLPSRCIGFMQKKGNILSHFNSRFVALEPIKGFMQRFLKKEDYPLKPMEILPLNELKSCLMKNYKKKDNYFYLEIIFNSNISIYRFSSEKACNEWNKFINESATFVKFWKKKEKIYPDVPLYLNSLKNKQVIINYTDGEIKEVKENNNNSINVKINTENRIKNIKMNKSSLDSYCVGFNSFELLDCLGAGSFGKVFKVKMKSNGEIYAMKVINKKFLYTNQQMRYAITECNVLKQASSPFILSLHYSFQTPENLYMIIDYCPGGDLNFHIQQNLFEEEEAKFYIAELILGIEHLHKLDIIYRDLKPENILISADNHIKLADFGLAKEGIENSQTTKSFCGSPAYLSPEMWERKGAGKSADIYGIGAVLYEMICGTPPFYATNIKALYRNVSQSKLELHAFFSDELKDLLKKLLSKNPLKRIGVFDKNEIKNHDWFKGINWEKIQKKETEPPLNLVLLKKEMEEDNGEFVLKTIPFNDTDYNSSNKKLHRIPGFTFIRK